MATLDFSGLPAPVQRVPVDELVSHHADAVILEPDDRIEDLAAHLDQVKEVTLTLPRFGDGRVYSQARRLREQFGFEGRIRVEGDVLLDQVRFLVRCGVNVLELADGISIDAAKAALERFTGDYQPAADKNASIIDRRRAARGN